MDNGTYLLQKMDKKQLLKPINGYCLCPDWKMDPPPIAAILASNIPPIAVNHLHIDVPHAMAT